MCVTLRKSHIRRNVRNSGDDKPKYTSVMLSPSTQLATAEKVNNNLKHVAHVKRDYHGNAAIKFVIDNLFVKVYISEVFTGGKVARDPS